MLSIGIIGASGYTGFELVKIAYAHPKIKNIKLYGHSSSGESFNTIFPAEKKMDLLIEDINQLDLDLDVYFLALPHTKSMEIVDKLIDHGKHIIDLSADFRLNSSQLYNQVYSKTHILPNFLEKKVYGLPEAINKEAVKGAKLIANPGCFPTVTLLALLPFVNRYKTQISTISSVAYSGTSGAGKSSDLRFSYSEQYGNTKAYSVLDHRHQPEIEQELKNTFPYVITMHLLPVKRGIYATHTIHLKEIVSYKDIIEHYEKHYDSSPFVRLRESPPELNWVVNSNYCDINIRVLQQTVVITSCIDNLIKGASGQAIQNMNIVFGFDETEGLI